VQNTSYTGLTAKICAMRANTFTKENFNSILELNSVEDVHRYLLEQPKYKNLFEYADENKTAHRSQLELLLSFSYFDDFLKIYNFANGKQRQILNFLFEKFEIDVIKKCLTCMHLNIPVLDLNGFSAFFNKHSSINVDALCKSRSMNEFVDNLSSTPYYSLFRSMNEQGIVDLYEYKTQLDIMYYKRLWKQRKSIRCKTSQNIFVEICGIDIDMQNIINMYRLKKHYNLEPEEIKRLIIPIRYKLKKNVLQELINSSTIEEFINIFNQTYYKRAGFDFNTIQESHYEILNRVYKNTLKKHPSSIANVLYYFFTRSNEIKAITTILECVRYNIKPKNINNYVITV